MSRLIIILIAFETFFTSKSDAQLCINGGELIIGNGARVTVNTDLVVKSSSILDPKLKNWGTLTVKGDVEISSTATYKGQGEVELTGSSKQTLSANNLPLKKIEVENGNNVELETDFNLQGSLTLTNGHLVCGDYDLIIDDSVTISGGNSSSYIRINGTGKVKTKVGSNPRLLPIGRNPYLPIIIDDGGGAEFTVGLSEGVYNNPENQTNLQTNNVVGETWIIQSSASQSNVSVTLQWNSSEEESGFARSAAHFSYWEDGVSTTWDLGSQMSASGSGPYSLSRTINFTANPFYFGVGSAGSALPVEFTHYNAQWQVEGETAIITWQTALEENNSHFEVERSFDASTWEQIGRVEGQGTTFDISDYQFVDDGLESKVQSLKSQGLWTLDLEHYTVYYRLKQVDYNGAFDYSEIRTLNFKQETRNSFDVWPNPVAGNVINLSAVDDYEVVTIEGMVIKRELETNRIDISDLAEGAYMIRNKNGQVQTFIKN